MSKSTKDKTEQIVRGISGRGLRLKLLTQTGNTIPADIIRSVNQVTTNYSQDTIVGRTLAARIIASALGADGTFNGHDPTTWNLGTTALQYARDNSNGNHEESVAYNQMLTRLVRCCSLPLKEATPHIYSLATFLLSRGYQLNFNRLYNDLMYWDSSPHKPQLMWATAFCDVKSFPEKQHL